MEMIYIYNMENFEILKRKIENPNINALDIGESWVCT